MTRYPQQGKDVNPVEAIKAEGSQSERDDVFIGVDFSPADEYEKMFGFARLHAKMKDYGRFQRLGDALLTGRLLPLMRGTSSDKSPF